MVMAFSNIYLIVPSINTVDTAITYHAPCSSNPIRTECLQTKLQATIAYACYDSDVILKSGDSAKVKELSQKIFDMYMPAADSDDLFI